MSYQEFLKLKRRVDVPTGMEIARESISSKLFPFQRDVVRWALRRGRAAIFGDCGLGKTPMQLVWADHVARHTGKPVMILAPLAVAAQTAREGTKFDVHVTTCRRQADVKDGVNIANYEMLEHFDPSAFGGVVLDESSILKSYDGAYRTAIIEAFRRTPYRLACTATPAPNDHMELGNHAEFLGTMTRTEMLSMFFVHDGGETQTWRLKGHAESEFWRWVTSWALMFRKPSDLGYSDDGFSLPAIEYFEHVIHLDPEDAGLLFDVGSPDLIARRRARKNSTEDRAHAAAKIVNESTEPWVVWCDLNAESEALASMIDGAVEVTGSQPNDEKERRMLDFSEGRARVIVTKPKIAGFGMNWQHCRNVMFVGLSDSYEAIYQAVRRCWRFGQEREVRVHFVTASTESAVRANVKRKELDAERMLTEMVAHMADSNREEVQGTVRTESTFAESVATGERWKLHLGDCVDTVGRMEPESVDFSIFSPPFASLYTYSNSDRDMGNCVNHDEFARHFQFLVRELFRVTRPGRLCSFHCMNLPTSKVRDVEIGIADFRGDLIRAFLAEGWIYHSEVVIWKDPVTAMQRTKALGLLHKQLKKDSCMSRQGIPDYLVTMRKPGVNTRRVENTNETFPVSEWQKIASPIWMDIQPNDTLQKESAREENDERHICPLQLEVIRRAMRLWSREDDLVLSPFTGIGSEGYVALDMGRRFVGVELKRSYFDQARKNLANAERNAKQADLFSTVDVDQ